MKCPKCGNQDIEFKEGYRGINRVIAILVLFCELGLSIVFLFVNGWIIASVLLFLLAVITSIGYRIRQVWLRRKSHTKAVCKQCGHTWFID